MGPKPTGKDNEDMSCERFYAKYKLLCKQYQLPVSPQVTEKYVEAVDAGEFLNKFNIWEELGWHGVKILMEALLFVKYQHTRSIRLWNTGCEDEGTRAICKYLSICPTTVVLELLQNNITALGCQFIGRLVNPHNLESKCQLQILKLDHNPIGSEGMMYLSEGLRMNKEITNLSLTYCNIDERGARYIFELLIFQNSELDEIDLGGNHLRNAGTIEVLRGASIAKNLSRISLFDNQFLEEDDVMDAIEFCMKKNDNLGRYNFKYNFIGDAGVERICGIMSVAPHVYDVEIPERISKAIMEMFAEARATNKPKKGKGKGAKGKGKARKKV